MSIFVSYRIIFVNIAASSGGDWTLFPEININGAMMLVRRVRGKFITSVLCSIACNICAQCNAHTYEQTKQLFVG